MDAIFDVEEIVRIPNAFRGRQLFLGAQSSCQREPGGYLVKRESVVAWPFNSKPHIVENTPGDRC